MVRWGLGFLVLSAFVSFANAKPETEFEHWQTVDLKFHQVEKRFNDTYCYTSKRHLLACTHAADVMLSLIEPGLDLVSNARLLKEPELGTVKFKYGEASVIKIAKLPKKLSKAELLKAARNSREKETESWNEIFAEGKKPVPFEEIREWVKASEPFKEREILFSAALLNTTEMVLNDPHTTFVPASVFEASQSENGGRKFAGIGVLLDTIVRDDVSAIVVSDTIAEKPAAKAGLLAGDRITHVDGVAVDLKAEDPTRGMRGAPGTKVEITIDRGGEIKKFTIVREEIESKNVDSKMIPDTKLGYIKLDDFVDKAACKDMKAAVKDLQESGAEGLVLDLRGNMGGYLHLSVCIGNIFLPLGRMVVATKDTPTASVPEPKFSEMRGINQHLTDLPLVVLTNYLSASASEIVAGAIQDHQRGVVIGETTYGKGSVQQVHPAPWSDKVHYARTMARFYMPTKRTNQLLGIVPDIEVFRKPDPTEDDKVHQREADLYLALPAIGEPWVQPRVDEMKKISECVEKTGTAKATYTANRAKFFPVDYQLGYGVDALKCMLNEKIATGIGPDVNPLPPGEASDYMRRFLKTVNPDEH